MYMKMDTKNCTIIQLCITCTVYSMGFTPVKISIHVCTVHILWDTGLALHVHVCWSFAALIIHVSSTMD